MGVTDKIWGALTSMIKLEDKVKSLSEGMKGQQVKIENLTERVIRLETQLEMLMRAVELKRIQN
jgi:archaellum component FlaC